MMTEKIRIALIKHNMSVNDLAASIGLHLPKFER